MTSRAGASARWMLVATVGCATAPNREPEQAALRPPLVESIVQQSTVTVAPVDAAALVGGLTGAGIGALAWERQRKKANEGLLPLRTVTADFDFEAQYALPLARAIKDVPWLRAAEMVRLREPSTHGGAAGRNVLRVDTRHTLSPDLTVLEVRSVVDFFPA